MDADNTGQTNLFKYLAGLNPLDPTSRFVLTIRNVAGQAGQMALSFSPRYDGRIYIVQYTTNLAQPNWTTLTSSATGDSGTTRTVTDLSAPADTPRFYRVRVGTP